MTDWSSEYAEENKRRASANVLYTDGSLTRTAAISQITGKRYRYGKSSNPKRPDGIRMSSSYGRGAWIAVKGPESPTIINDWDSSHRYRQVLYPERFPSIGYTGVPSRTWDNMQARADTEVLVKLGEGKAQLINDLLEARKTFDMLVDTTIHAAKTLLAVRRGDWKEVYKNLGLPDYRKRPRRRRDNRVAIGVPQANAWLQYQYGWKPLAASLFEYQELLKSYTDKRKYMRVVREIKTEDTFDFDDVRWYFERVSGTAKVQASVKTVLYARLLNNFIHQAGRWGVTNPASILWEATPYSFAIDWVAPVGNVIAAWSATAGLEFITGSRTKRFAWSGDGSGKAISTINSWNIGSLQSKSEFRIEAKGMDRQALSGFPQPDFYVKNPFSTTHAANALALLRKLW